MIAIVTAMKAEFECFEKHILFKEKADKSSNCILRGILRGKDVMVVQSGVGEERVLNAISSVLDKYPIEFIISTGVAGALSPDLRTGDIIIGEKVLSMREKIFYSDSALINACVESCKKLRTRYFSGAILTSSKFVSSSNDKMRLFREYGALAVEMESAFIAMYAVEKGIPFLAVRAISDMANNSFNIDYQKLKRNSLINLCKLLIYFIMHPTRYLEIMKYKSNRKLAVCLLCPLIEELVN